MSLLLLCSLSTRAENDDVAVTSSVTGQLWLNGTTAAWNIAFTSSLASFFPSLVQQDIGLMIYERDSTASTTVSSFTTYTPTGTAPSFGAIATYEISNTVLTQDQIENMLAQCSLSNLNTYLSSSFGANIKAMPISDPEQMEVVQSRLVAINGPSLVWQTLLSLVASESPTAIPMYIEIDLQDSVDENQTEFLVTVSQDTLLNASSFYVQVGVWKFPPYTIAPLNLLAANSSSSSNKAGSSTSGNTDASSSKTAGTSGDGNTKNTDVGTDGASERAFNATALEVTVADAETTWNLIMGSYLPKFNAAISSYKSIIFAVSDIRDLFPDYFHPQIALYVSNSDSSSGDAADVIVANVTYRFTLYFSGDATVWKKVLASSDEDLFKYINFDAYTALKRRLFSNSIDVVSVEVLTPSKLTVGTLSVVCDVSQGSTALASHVWTPAEVQSLLGLAAFSNTAYLYQQQATALSSSATTTEVAAVSMEFKLSDTGLTAAGKGVLGMSITVLFLMALVIVVTLVLICFVWEREPSRKASPPPGELDV